MREYLSWPLEKNTPTYGGREKFEHIKSASMEKGDAANSSGISMNLHVGTHLDTPLHFCEKGNPAETYPADFWFFDNPLVVDIKPCSKIVKDELIGRLAENAGDFDILIVNTGQHKDRANGSYMMENIGFHPEVAMAIREFLPRVRVFGFDTISVSSYTDRMLGREAHRRFLCHEKPILLLEDMMLGYLNKNNNLKSVILMPLRIVDAEAVPVSVVGEFYA